MEITSTHLMIAGGIVVWMIGGFFARRLARKVREQRRAAGEVVPEPNRALGAVILAVIVFAFAVVLGPGMLAEARHDELVETGTPATAKIVAVEETGNVYNRRPEVALTLEVQPEGGTPFQSQAEWIFSVMDIQTYRVGETVDVFFDPADTEVVAVVGVAAAP